MLGKGILLCAQEKRKAEDAGLVESGADEAAEDDSPATPPAVDEAAAAADLEGMKKTMMKRKDRHLYQSILNRQKAKKQRVEQLEKRKAGTKAQKGKK